MALVGQVPPPLHGQALANRYLVDGHYARIRLNHVPMRFSTDLTDVGRFRWGKVLRLGEVILRLWGLVLLGRRDVLVMTLGLRNRLPLLRDAAILSLTRPLFRATVLHVHSGGWSEQLDRLPGLVRRVVERAYGAADLVIYLDESLRDDALPEPRRVAYLPCGVEDPLPLLPPAGTGPPDEVEAAGASSGSPADGGSVPAILFLGNLYEAKGTHVLARAAGLLARSGLEFRVVLAGAMPSEEEQSKLDELVKELDLGDRLAVVGPVGGATKYRAFADATVFCFPTYFEAEAMPLVVFEAMAHGLPVVSTTWRGIPSQVVEGVTGYLVEPGDVEALADRLRLLLEDPALALAAGRRGRERFEACFEVEQFRHGFERLVLVALAAEQGAPSRDDGRAAHGPVPVPVEG